MDLKMKLVRELIKMYEKEPKGRKSMAPIVFGAMYYKELKEIQENSPYSIADIAECALGMSKYDAEIRKGMKLNEYFDLQPK